METGKIKQAIFITGALFFIATGIYHLVGLFYPVNDSPMWRHGLFIAINLICAYGLIKRPRCFVYFFGVLLVQQLYSHGGHLLNIWNTEHRIDAIDTGVVMAMLLFFVLLIIDLRHKKP